MNTKFTIMIEDAEDASHTIAVEADLPPTGTQFLDRTEQMLLHVFHTLGRETYRWQAEHQARQLAETAQTVYGGSVVQSPHRYRIDGEMGRMTVATYRVEDGHHVLWTPEADGFPVLGSREHYVTANFRELVLTLTSRMSYRDTAQVVQRIRQGEADARTPLITLADWVEREGAAVQAWIEQKTAAVLSQSQFTAAGAPTPEATITPLAADRGRLAQSAIDEAMVKYNADKPSGQQIPPAAAQAFYEDPAAVINISIDDVSVKKQKTHRKPSAAKAAASEASSATEADDHGETLQATGSDVPGPTEPQGEEAPKRVHNTIAQVHSPAGQYLLSGRNTAAVLRILVAFLLTHHAFATHRIQFFADGARDLHRAIVRAFGWVPSRRIVLDWFHLEKKCGEYLSLALAGRTIRKEVQYRLTGYLWVGRVDEAITYLQHLRADQVKSQKQLELTVDYLQRHRNEIPCYALRAALGLRNSSNRGEKANDRCVADRQKSNGMSWSPDGSTRLTSTTTVLRNHELTRWSTDRELGWQWVA